MIGIDADDESFSASSKWPPVVASSKAGHLLGDIDWNRLPLLPLGGGGGVDGITVVAGDLLLFLFIFFALFVGFCLALGSWASPLPLDEPLLLPGILPPFLPYSFFFFFGHSSADVQLIGIFRPLCCCFRSISAAGAVDGTRLLWLWFRLFEYVGLLVGTITFWFTWHSGRRIVLAFKSMSSLPESHKCLMPCFTWFAPNKRAINASDRCSGTISVNDFTYVDSLPSDLLAGK